MTDAAILGRRQVRGDRIYLAGRGNTVVTGIAAYGQHRGIAVVHEHGREIDRIMTQGAISRGQRVWRAGRLRPGTDACEAAVVTGYAITTYPLVSRHRSWCHEGIDIVAGVAILAGRHVIGLLDQFFRRAGGQGQELAGMATCASVRVGAMNRG